MIKRQNILIIAMMISLFVPVLVNAAPQQGTLEYNFYIPNQQGEETSAIQKTLQQITLLGKQAQYQTKLRNEAIEFCRDSRKRTNKMYWLFEIIKQDAQRMDLQIQIFRLAYSLAAETQGDEQKQKEQIVLKRMALEEMQHSVQYVRELLLKNGDGVSEIAFLEASLTQNQRIIENNINRIGQSGSSDLAKAESFQRVGEEYLRLYHQLEKIVIRETSR